MARYPKAVWKPLQGHSNPGTLQQRNGVILHITDGTSLPFDDFQRSPDGNGGKSSHFCIDRDGTVYQYVDVSDTAWHANGVNLRTVGIEHVSQTQLTADKLNLQDRGNRVATPATPEQYAASTELVYWLCKQMNIPPDRRHVQEHCEASPHDGHPLCCHGGLDPDKVVTAVRGKFFYSTSANQRVLLALGPGTPWLRLSEIRDRVKLHPGDFIPDLEAILRDLERTGAVTLMRQRGRIIMAFKNRP